MTSSSHSSCIGLREGLMIRFAPPTTAAEISPACKALHAKSNPVKDEEHAVLRVRLVFESATVYYNTVFPDTPWSPEVVFV